jgi:signal transduction histidine kinase
MIESLNKMSVQLSLLALTLFLCAGAIFLPSRDYAAINGIEPTAMADYALASSDDIVQTMAWVPTTLPHDWAFDSLDTRQRWYRITFDAPSNIEDSVAVYAPMLAHHASFHLNGQWLAQTGDLTPKMERHHNTPQWIEFSASILKPQDNTLVIKVSANVPDQGILAPVYIGAASELRSAYRLKMFVRVDWVQWCSLTMYLISAILALFWFNRRKDIVYGIFALELFVWATHNLNLFVQRIPVPHRTWEAMTMATLGWTIVLILLFNFKFLNRPSPRMEKFMLYYAAAGLLFFMLPRTEWILLIGYTLWDACLIIFGSYAMVYLTKAYRSPQRFDAWLMMLVGVPILLAGLHDILLVNRLWPKTDGLYIQYSVIPTGLLFGWFLFRRFIQSLTLAEQHAQLLVQKVNEKETQLTEQFQHIKSMELQSMLSQERERIMRDMHDGIGGQLLAIQSRLNQKSESWVGPIKTQVRSTIADFRLVIDSLDPLVNDVSTLMGQMRPRLQTLLDIDDIELQWHIQDIPDEPPLSPEQVLQIMRILQEAVTNALKHANTPWIRVSTSLLSGKVCIRIEDAGIGCTEQTDNKGRGLKNMEYRAEKIGASLAIQSSDKGTCVQLCL